MPAVNKVATSAIGFVFWTLAAHRYSASTVGVFSSVTSGTALLAAIAALGLPITMTGTSPEPTSAHLVLVAITIITTAGHRAVPATVLFLGPIFPPPCTSSSAGK